MKRRSFIQLLGLAAAPTAILAKTDKPAIGVGQNINNNPIYVNGADDYLRPVYDYVDDFIVPDGLPKIRDTSNHKADQWSAEDLAKMDAKNSKPLIFNRLGIKVNG